MKILSTLSTIASAVPKPPLSILRFGSLAAGATPVTAGLLVGSVVAVKAFEHRAEIKSTIGNLADKVKSNSPLSTLGKMALEKKEVQKDGDFPILIPILVIGTSLVVLYVIMRK
jgi:hypothetical protein